MANGIDPKVDFAFKRVLGNPEHTAITVHFLNAVLGDSRRITLVEILNPILGQETDDDKLAILDVRAQDDQGRWLNIEMQTANQTGLRQRLTFYAASLYVGQMHSGDAYNNLRPAISICVLDTLLFPSVPDLHLDFQMRNGRHGLVLTDAEFTEAAGVLEMIAQSPQEREMYEARLKFERDQVWRLRAAKDEGIEQGIERGEVSGRIRVLQVLLGLPESPLSELAGLELEQLSRMAIQLQAQVSDRR